MRAGKRFNGVSARPGSTADRWSRAEILIRRQVSITDMMAVTFGPACGLPIWIQFFLPKTIGRIEFSARLVISSNSGYSRRPHPV